MDELTRKALVEQVENVIADFEERQLSETDLEDLNYEQLKCISECLQFGQLKGKLIDTLITYRDTYAGCDDFVDAIDDLVEEINS